MPNWCENTLIVSNGDPKVIARMVEAYGRDELFYDFIPCPKELLSIDSDVATEEVAQRMIEKYNAKDWYNWRCNNWGTKWDVGDDRQGNHLEIVSPTEIKLFLLTAWSPPLPVLDHWVDLGCNIVGSFLEPGIGYSAIYRNKVIWVRAERRELPDDIDGVLERLVESVELLTP